MLSRKEVVVSSITKPASPRMSRNVEICEWPVTKASAMTDAKHSIIRAAPIFLPLLFVFCVLGIVCMYSFTAFKYWGWKVGKGEVLFWSTLFPLPHMEKLHLLLC